MYKLFFLMLLIVYLMNCKSPNDPNDLDPFRNVIARINTIETTIKDSTVLSNNSDIKSIDIKTNDIVFGFNDSIWNVDSSNIFINHFVTFKISAKPNHKIENIEVSDSSIILLGQKFKQDLKINDTIIFIWENSGNLNKIKINCRLINDSLHIPIFIEMQSDTIVSFISNISIDMIVKKRRSILNAPTKYNIECCPYCDTICIPTVRVLPFGFNTLVTYLIGEMIIPFH